MPRYKLRTLLIVLVLVPPMLAGAWWVALSIPRPKSYAEAFTLFLICFNTTFVACYLAARWTADWRSKRQSSN
jgi:hypothetical protein